MIFTETKLKGAFTIEANLVEDERGFFRRAWCKREFAEHGLNANAVQANVSYSKKKGTIRGFHFQIAPFSETKTVTCITGAIFDVIIDLRPQSPTFKQWIGVELKQESGKVLFIPEGFAHGFYTLRDDTTVHYTVTEFYTPSAELGIKYDDPAFDIQWPGMPVVISEKDNNHAPFKEESLFKQVLT